MYTQALRVKRICSEEKDFEQHIHEIRSWFQDRAYPNKDLDGEQVKVRFSNQEKTCSKKGKDILFVVMYHPMLQALKNIIKRNLIKRNLNWLYADNEVKNLFSPRPMVSFRCARKLNSYLVRAKIYPLERKVGSCSCGKKRCQVCLNVSETNSFTISLNYKGFKSFGKQWLIKP